VIGLGAAGAALGLLLLAAMPPAPSRHATGAGPLSTAGEPWSMGLDPAADDRWTLGIYLCATDPADRLVIDSVTPVRAFGTYRFLGAQIREFAPTEADGPIISIPGYPPDVPGPLRDVAGFTVSAGCSAAERSATYTELLLGIGRGGKDAGGWLGEEVAYQVGSRRYVLALGYAMLVCGAAAPEGYC
jgi:hypothetical protein